ncbi:MAG: VCBS repeat-containing protein [Cyclobacteriaceae bacterium]
MRVFVFGYLLLVLMACSFSPTENNSSEQTLFRLRDQAHTNINFINQLDYTEQLNPYTFKNFYNGGGVGLGDFNNDGLLDVFFSGNLVSNKLYLNKGNFQFQDVSKEAGVSNNSVWTTGVSIADINADGFLDIYLCKSGPPGGEGRHNELFINNADMTFSEQSQQYGLDFDGLSTHAAFFDYDKDGDLDCYLLNNSLRSVGAYDLRKNQRDIPDMLGGNKLLRNDGGKFINVSLSAGIYTSEIGFGLGVTIGDINKDGWSDIYISNDFFEKDYLYINQMDGKFKESLEEFVREISLGSMGADMADINNDGFPEIFVTEMLPESDDRLKTTSQFENWDKYYASVDKGYYHQFSRNVLQLNNGDGTFSEIARFAGVQATDWSWGALIFDMNKDGFKDIFVANGIYKDLLDQDYVNFVSDRNVVREILLREGSVIKQLIDSIPSNRIPNYAFENKGNLVFDNKAKEWGLDNPTHSNGSAYGDLDNDGDLDLVLNNVNMQASIYENQSESLNTGNASLSVMLHGVGKNTFALGAKITLKAGGKLFYQEHSPMRGFMSSVDYKMNFGLGNIQIIDSLIVEWPNDQVTIQTKVTPNQLLHLYQKDAADLRTDSNKKFHSPIFAPVKFKDVNFQHSESKFVDFDRERLLFNMISNEGPCLCVGDVNGDGLQDFYIGGAKNQAGSLFVQKKSGGFINSNPDVFAADKTSEDTDCIFFDANGDGRQDLYVTSGGNEFSSSSTALIDRLYFNMKSGKFEKSKQILPIATRFESTSTVEQNDYDHDGDLDLFVGVRVIPGLYGVPCNGYILNNDGKGNFTEVTLQVAPGFKNLGLIRDAKWVDIDNDSYSDLVVVGEWMEISLFMNRKGKAFEIDLNAGFYKTSGWYNTLEAGDFNGDGWIDLVIGNHGLNSRFKASESEPLNLYINDFDENGSVEHITTRYFEGKSLPLVLRQDLVMQMPFLKKKYFHFKDYIGQTIPDIFTSEQLSKAIILNAFTLETALWLNKGDGTFRKKSLPLQVQFSPVYAILIDDFDGDKNLDIIMGGNLYRAKPETGIYDGSYGVVLKGDGNGNFTYIPALKSGISIIGEVRGLKKIFNGKKILVVAKNNDQLQFYRY